MTRDSRTWRGGPVTPRAYCVLASNPGPMTLDGTNTWVLLEPGSTEAVVVDPGPDEPGHRTAIVEVLERRSATVALILLTHSHRDHSDGVAALAHQTGAPVRMMGSGASALTHGERIEVGGMVIDVIGTPGHTADSMSFVVPADGVLLTGDTILGRGSTVVASPDGNLAAYLHSLERLASVTATAEVRQLLPGHGPVVRDAAAKIAEYRQHRQDRLAQVRRALAAAGLLGGEPTAEDVVLSQVYGTVPEPLWPAARASIRAQLDYLIGQSRG